MILRGNIMILRSCFSILGILLSCVVNAQKSPAAMNDTQEIPLQVLRVTDSLKRVLEITKNDSVRLMLYGKICWSYMSVPALATARYYADSVQLLSQHLGDSSGMIRASYYYGVIARLRGDYREALVYLNDYIRYVERKGDSSRVAGGLYQVGNIYSRLGDYDKSLKAYYRSLAIEQSADNAYSIGYTLNTIATVLKETGKHTDAEAIYKRALHIFDSLDERWDQTDVLVNLGNLYTETGRLDVARTYYNDALRIDRQTGKLDGVALSLANIAFLFDKMRQYDSALVYHLQGLSIREGLPSKEGIARSLIGVGLGYKQLKEYGMARRYLNRAHDLVTTLGSKPMKKDVYEHLSALHAAENNFEKTYRFHLLYSGVSDSLLSEQRSRQLNEMQTRYETAEKDQQIALLASEKQISQIEAQRQAAIRKTLIAGLVATGLLAGLIIYIFRQRFINQQLVSLKNEAVREAEFNLQVSELEMKALRAQINPHFLFNCMNAINRMILDGENKEASNYLAKFSKLIRMILENAGSASVSLEQDLLLLESYIQLEMLRFRARISYRIIVDEVVDRENTFVPSMILQPYVENAIWHGLMHKTDGEQGVLTIQIRQKDHLLHCSIEDNGIGREKSRQLQGKSVLKNKSIGMKITEERLRLISRGREEQVVKIIDIKDAQDRPTGTRVEVLIPIT